MLWGVLLGVGAFQLHALFFAPAKAKDENGTEVALVLDTEVIG